MFEDNNVTLQTEISPKFQIRCQHCGSSYTGLEETIVNRPWVKHVIQCYRPSCYGESILQVNSGEEGVNFETYKEFNLDGCST